MAKITYVIDKEEYRVVDAQKFAVLLQNVRKETDKRIVSALEFSRATILIRHEQRFGCRAL